MLKQIDDACADPAKRHRKEKLKPSVGCDKTSYTGSSLPLHEAHAKRKQPRRTAILFSKGDMNDIQQQATKHILVVEDYLDSQEITCELLRLMGHTVTGVTNAEDALTYTDSNHIDILLTDINLPKMSGIDLARQVIAKRPDTHVIFASGHAGFDVKTLDFSATMLPKPFDLDALAQALSAIA